MDGYGQYCPLAKGAEVFAERWTPLLLRELLRGSVSFNDLHRGVPRMSRSLLSSRLKKLEACGVLASSGPARAREYRLTESGRALAPVVRQLGTWGQRWFRTRFDPAELDAGVLMWDIRCTVDPGALAAGRSVVEFEFGDAPAASRRWWLVDDPHAVDLCPFDPGEEVDLTVRTTLAVLTRVWMGDLALEQALRSRELRLEGAPRLRGSFRTWLSLSPYARIAPARR
jgi:DNA-binding HxlR family transcriptional regulator